jgi:hypothetical protein
MNVTIGDVMRRRDNKPAVLWMPSNMGIDVECSRCHFELTYEYPAGMTDEDYVHFIRASREQFASIHVCPTSTTHGLSGVAVGFDEMARVYAEKGPIR